jgi:hypothetical protein
VTASMEVWDRVQKMALGGRSRNYPKLCTLYYHVYFVTGRNVTLRADVWLLRHVLLCFANCQSVPEGKSAVYGGARCGCRGCFEADSTFHWNTKQRLCRSTLFSHSSRLRHLLPRGQVMASSSSPGSTSLWLICLRLAVELSSWGRSA